MSHNSQKPTSQSHRCPASSTAAAAGLDVAFCDQHRLQAAVKLSIVQLAAAATVDRSPVPSSSARYCQGIHLSMLGLLQLPLPAAAIPVTRILLPWPAGSLLISCCSCLLLPPRAALNILQPRQACSTDNKSLRFENDTHEPLGSASSQHHCSACHQETLDNSRSVP